MLLILAGFVLIVLSLLRGAARASGGGVLLIGPLPVVFGTDARAAKLALILALALLLAMLILYASWWM